MAPGSNLALAQPLPLSQPEPISVARPLLPTVEAIEPYLRRIDANRWYSNLGPLCLEFEARLAERFGLKDDQLSTISNATVGLVLALQTAGARPGTHCLVPSWTFSASIHAVLGAGRSRGSAGHRHHSRRTAGSARRPAPRGCSPRRSSSGPDSGFPAAPRPSAGPGPAPRWRWRWWRAGRPRGRSARPGAPRTPGRGARGWSTSGWRRSAPDRGRSPPASASRAGPPVS